MLKRIPFLILYIEYTTILSTFLYFLWKSFFPGSDIRPTQVGDMDPWPVIWHNLSDLIGCGQKVSSTSWTSCQIRKIAGAHAPGIPVTFSPSPQVSDPDMHHGTCVAHVPWCMPGSLTSGFLWNRRRGGTIPAFPAHAQPAILPIWYEAHGRIMTVPEAEDDFSDLSMDCYRLCDKPEVMFSLCRDATPIAHPIQWDV